MQSLYYGELLPAEQYLPRIAEFKEMRQNHYRHYEEFMDALKKLDGRLVKQFIEIMDEQFDEVPLEYAALFIDGFRLGARMMIEVFSPE